MKDLCSTLFYNVGFTIEGRKKNTNLLLALLLDINKWLVDKSEKKESFEVPLEGDKWINLLMKSGGSIQGKRINITSECCRVDDPFKAVYWTCKIVETPESKRDIAPRQWTTEIGFKPLSQYKAQISCVISYKDYPDSIKESEDNPKPNIPGIVRILQSDRKLICSNGIDKLTFKPKLLKSGDFKDFWERIINPERSIPYIYVSPNTEINTSQLATMIGGNAIIYYANDPEVYNEMRDVWFSAYQCENGGIRIYMPNVDVEDDSDPFRHRYIKNTDIERLGCEKVMQILHRVIVKNSFVFCDYFRTEDCKRKKSVVFRQKRMSALLENHEKELERRNQKIEEVKQNALSDKKSYEKDISDIFDICTESEAENKELWEENEKLSDENKKLNFKISGLTECLKSKSSDDNDQNLIELCNFIVKLENKDPKEVVEFLLPIYKDNIDFTEKGLKSLKDCEIPPDELFKALHYLSTTMHRLYLEKGSGDIYKKFTEETGIEATRGEGSQTRKNKDCMDQRNDVYNEHPLVMEPHLKLSNHQRIHFAFCDEEEKVVVGWCAGHLATSATKNLRKR